MARVLLPAWVMRAMRPGRRTLATILLSGAAVAVAVAAGARARASSQTDDEGSSTDATALRRHDTASFPIERTIPPPAPVAPRYGDAMSASTTLSWQLDDRTDGARVELSPTPDFDEASTVRLDADGNHIDVPTSPGVWYWRLRGRSESAVGDRISHTWMFYVPEKQARLVMPPSLARLDPRSNGDADDSSAPSGWGVGPLIRLYMP
jgi:hypothetical protein